MNVVLCIENRGGMLFNHRRLSQDRAVRAHILKDAAGQKLWMNAYSAGQFTEEERAHISLAEDFLERAESGDFCFVEDQDITPYAAKIERIILYLWNRDYPSDMQFTFDLSEWHCIAREDFSGYSHEKLTREVFER